jgi:LuxR family maltose regulon positive regulatory protein
VYAEKILTENVDPPMLKKAGNICKVLIDRTKEQKRIGPCINYLVLASKVKEAEGQFNECRLLLDEAAVLAKDEHYHRPFLEHLSPVEGLNYVKKDVLHLKKEMANQKLIEPLTIRELEVLVLIVSGLSNQEISNRLFLALSTVKGYNQNIYAKLGVKRRTEAVAKARELGII